MPPGSFISVGVKESIPAKFTVYTITKQDGASKQESAVLTDELLRLSGDTVTWQPQPFTAEQSVNAIERAMEIVVQPPVHAFYTTQFAGDMCARFDNEAMTLLQTWSEDDLQRVQENLIGHLVTQKRLKLSPTLFIATLDSELDVISVCNLSGEVIKETLGTRNRDVLAPSLADFLTRIEPLL